MSKAPIRKVLALAALMCAFSYPAYAQFTPYSVSQGGTGNTAFATGTIPFGLGRSPLATSSLLTWATTTSRLSFANGSSTNMGVSGTLFFSPANYVYQPDPMSLTIHTGAGGSLTAETGILAVPPGGIITVDQITDNSANNGINFNASGNILVTGTADTLFQNSSGAVGIGTTTPYSPLTVEGTTTASCFNVVGTSGCLTSGGGSISGGSTNTLTYWTSPTTVSATGSPAIGYLTATSTTATTTFRGNVAVSATTTVAGMPGGGSATVNDGGGTGDYIYQGSTQSVRVYAYAVSGGVTYYSPYLELRVNDLDTFHNDQYSVTWSWNAVQGADGYKLLKSDSDFCGYSYDFYAVTNATSYSDEGCSSWTPGSLVTPASNGVLARPTGYVSASASVTAPWVTANTVSSYDSNVSNSLSAGNSVSAGQAFMLGDPLGAYITNFITAGSPETDYGVGGVRRFVFGYDPGAARAIAYDDTGAIGLSLCDNGLAAIGNNAGTCVGNQFVLDYAGLRSYFSSGMRLGVGTTSPYATLSVMTGTSTGVAFAVSTTTGKDVFGVDNDGHRFSGGSAPAISTCGTGTGTVVGDDQVGVITTATAATACTATFAKPYQKAPVCTVTDDSLVGFASVSSVSTSAVTFGISSALTGGKLYYSCSYHR